LCRRFLGLLRLALGFCLLALLALLAGRLVALQSCLCGRFQLRFLATLVGDQRADLRTTASLIDGGDGGIILIAASRWRQEAACDQVAVRTGPGFRAECRRATVEPTAAGQQGQAAHAEQDKTHA
jgi:hypothetical protein